jgi:hypothetical protein
LKCIATYSTSEGHPLEEGTIRNLLTGGGYFRNAASSFKKNANGTWTIMHDSAEAKDDTMYLLDAKTRRVYRIENVYE